MLRHYLELVTELPWNKVFVASNSKIFPHSQLQSSEERIDIQQAREDLDADHYALDSVKKRVLEFLAVRKLNPQLTGPILCFAGPPGVGKTSIAKSIARTLGREFHRISLGGCRFSFDQILLQSQGAWPTNPTFVATEELILAGCC